MNFDDNDDFDISEFLILPEKKMPAPKKEAKQSKKDDVNLNAVDPAVLQQNLQRLLNSIAPVHEVAAQAEAQKKTRPLLLPVKKLERPVVSTPKAPATPPAAPKFSKHAELRKWLEQDHSDPNQVCPVTTSLGTALFDALMSRPPPPTSSYY